MRDWHLIVFQHYNAMTGSTAWPAIWAGSAPREAHRQRRREALLVVADFFGSARPELRAQERLLSRAVQTYFQTDGPVTAALKALAHTLHHQLHQANRRLAARGRQVLARMVVWVWRGNQVYLALIGPWQVYALAPQRLLFPREAEDWGPPLGLNQTPWVDYHRLPAETGPWLLAAEPLPDQVPWEDLLQADPRPALQAMLTSSPQPLRGLWLDAQPGSGHMRREDVQHAWECPLGSAPASPRPEQPPAPATTSQAATSQAAPSEDDTAPPEAKAPAPQEEPPAAKETRTRRSTTARPSRHLPDWRRPLARGLQRVAAVWPRLPTRVLFFLAVVVPLAVVAASLAVYVRAGNQTRQEGWLAVAQTHLNQARASEDVLQRRAALAQALDAVEQAARYGPTESVQAMRRQIQGELDALDRTRRLAFTPLIVGSLGEEVRLTRLALGIDDLYALDAEQNRIWRFRWVGGGRLRYENDARFRCRGQRYGTLDLSALVDVAVLPPARYDFRVLAVDQGGVLLTCDPEAGAQARPLPQPPSGWQQVQRAHVWEQRLYLLDRGANAFYSLDLERLATVAPQPLLGQAQVAPDFRNVVDFGLLGGEAYFLFLDTQIIHCRYFAAEEPQPCQALEYQDDRPGRSNGPVFPEAHFAQIAAVSRPEPALYLLDPDAQAVYRFSLALRLIEQYRPTEPLPDEVTAFAVGLGPDGADYLYLVTTRQIYAAPLP